MPINLKSCRILVTPTSYAKNDPRLRSELESAVGEVVYNQLARPLTSSEVAELLPGIDGYIAGLDIIDSSALDKADRLKVIARYGVGVDRVDLAAAARRSIVVVNTPGANSASVAELTLALMLSLARFIPQHLSEVHKGSWPRTVGVTIQGKTVGLLGFGAVGKEVARRLTAWNCRVVAYDPVPDTATASQLGVELRPWEEVVREADFLSLHMPVSAETRQIVNAEFLRKMKRGAFLVNTARGELLDEAALCDALQGGLLRGAGLDTFAKEPLPSDSTLLKLPQVVVTPHCGAHTDDAMDQMGWGALEGCLAVLRGEEPQHRVVPARVASV